MSKSEITGILNKIEPQVKARLAEFHEVRLEGDDERIFAELVFCLLTPQSKARTCWGAVESILDKDLLVSGGHDEILAEVSVVRFKNNKTRYILEAREQFLKSDKLYIKQIMNDLVTSGGPKAAREWLVENVKGMGMKEASHFLRNIGMGEELAILDRHILKNLVLLDVIREVPRSLSPKKYLVIETAMSEFAVDAGIPMGHLDLVLWYKETGTIFK